jgi:hypothetical protein
MGDWFGGDFPSWLAVAIALAATLIALRKVAIHSELHFTRLHFDDDGGPISLELELTTYSHAPRLDAHAKLKLDRAKYPMSQEPLTTPQNYRFATVSTFDLRFTGTYKKSKVAPKTAIIDVKVRMSDGSRARFKGKMPLVESNDPTGLPQPPA